MAARYDLAKIKLGTLMTDPDPESIIGGRLGPVLRSRGGAPPLTGVG